MEGFEREGDNFLNRTIVIDETLARPYKQELKKIAFRMASAAASTRTQGLIKFDIHEADCHLGVPSPRRVCA
jgi:hypothetical protein